MVEIAHLRNKFCLGAGFQVGGCAVFIWNRFFAGTLPKLIKLKSKIEILESNWLILMSKTQFY